MTAYLDTPAWAAVREAVAPRRYGVVRSVLGLQIEVAGLRAAVGDVLNVIVHGDDMPIEVVAAGDDVLHCLPLCHTRGLRAGLDVYSTGGPLRVPVGNGLLGRVLDGLGRPIDGRGPLDADAWVTLDGSAPHPLTRARVDAPMPLGVRVLDTLMTAGRGQRLGLFAGSGVGKSSLMSMIARGTQAEASVIALVGERGREVREFLEDDLGPEGLARSVVVVATSDQPPLVRLRSAFVATRIAEYLRDQGRHAVLMMDSLTRVAMAQREVGLSVGEPPTTRGYPPSTFALLAELLERAGAGETGSVTGLYSVLVEGDDHNEPIADAARSILDGHVVLKRELAVLGHFPAVDVIDSISRVAARVAAPEQMGQARILRAVLAAKRRAQDLLDVGAYVAGSDARVDAAVAHSEEIDAFLTQGMDERVSYDEAWAALAGLTAALGVS
jgi:flagellum-specific ATP synthase